MTPPSILILEDDLTFSLMLTTWLKKKGFDVTACSSLSDAKKKLEKEKYDLLLSDFRLPDGTGLDFLSWANGKKLHLPFIMMTSYADIPTAVQAIKSGATDYITKPLNPENLLIKINEALSFGQEKQDAEQFNAAQSPDWLEGQSMAARQLFQHVRLVAPTNMSVLITGSSGTGKEFVARRIHELSNRSAYPFVALDCGALSKELAVSEFFGHVKGAFTGAVADKQGAFVTAKGGTVFLDEIGNLSYEVQIQLLRAIQERKIKPLGSSEEIKVDVRFIAATNEDLTESMIQGGFREDLFHRINEFTIRVPDLHERDEDILLFANHFLDLANKELDKHVIGFDKETISLFRMYAWPGNLRQMKNTIRYATLIAASPYITLHDLPEEITESKVAATIPLKDAESECARIKKALQQVNNNKSRAAQLLGIDRKTLYNKLKLYKIE